MGTPRHAPARATTGPVGQVRALEAALRRSHHGRRLADALHAHRRHLVRLALDPTARALLDGAMVPIVAAWKADASDCIDPCDLGRCHDALDQVVRRHRRLAPVASEAHALLDELADRSMEALLAGVS